ncbi:hypothetical protein KDH_11440 [Dictyobacter sp. S3.2.2.5]|uniref:Uncharacterized protein n=1 Tax=Dictyobacter halimunensis TaxID=3026934 RepID=A0ABQ6FKV1_9CHLR|nr:hypothetical protein KDH_11440 [Dictyobacter sp. S3.2.2.5]
MFVERTFTLRAKECGVPTNNEQEARRFSAGKNGLLLSDSYGSSRHYVLLVKMHFTMYI